MPCAPRWNAARPSFPPTSPKRLVTSGYGGVFPPGLTLGTIVRAELGSDGRHKSGEVRLDERLGSLTEVTVLVPLDVDAVAPVRSSP